MSFTDSIKNELASHRGQVPENQWLAEKGIIETPDTPYSYNLMSDWHMPGSESYILDFEVLSRQRTERLIAKACIKSCATETVQEWHDRRQRIASAGIGVPKLYSTDRAVYIEEYIEMDMRAAHKCADPEVKSKLEDKFLDTYRKLGSLGFNVISLHDVRSHGDDIVLVDFGSDLGGYSDTPLDPKVTNEKALAELSKITRR